MPGLFDRFRGRSDDEPVDLEARSPESGLKYKDIALLGQMMQQGADLSQPRHALYYLYFTSPEAAEAAAVDGRGAGGVRLLSGRLVGYPPRRSARGTRRTDVTSRAPRGDTGST